MKYAWNICLQSAFTIKRINNYTVWSCNDSSLKKSHNAKNDQIKKWAWEIEIKELFTVEKCISFGLCSRAIKKRFKKQS